MGAELRLVATGVGDPADGSEAAIVFRGRSLRPPAPVHLRAGRDGAGGIVISWIRRSRTGALWGDGNTPLGEEGERYRVTIDGARAIETGAPAFTYSTADQAADGVTIGDAIDIHVVQLGTLAASEPAHISFTI
ncbi:hypothetical protein [Sphingomonas montanisoli]|uniref:hypothetical protein n=1 Tax=Sphingomonas montanisoli TaxID=2606412 RepID=UPI001FE77D47|nr:hypothetical protein [Sphingomonas montanisoli]